MDDLLFVSYMSYSKTAKLIKILIQMFEDFGVSLNHSKSVLVPSRNLVFLGYIVSATGTVALTDKRFNKLKTQTKQVIKSSNNSYRFITYSKLLAFLGVLVSCFDAIPLARIYAQSFYDCISTYRQLYSSEYFNPKYGVRGKRVKLNKTACKMLRTIESIPLAQCR